MCAAILVHSSQEGFFPFLYQALLLQIVEMRNLLSNAVLIYAELSWLIFEMNTAPEMTV